LILHFRRHLRVDRPRNDAIGLQLAQLLAEHLLRDRGDRAFQLGEMPHFPPGEMEEDHQFPAPSEETERGFDLLRGQRWRVHHLLTILL